MPPGRSCEAQVCGKKQQGAEPVLRLGGEILHHPVLTTLRPGGWGRSHACLLRCASRRGWGGGRESSKAYPRGQGGAGEGQAEWALLGGRAALCAWQRRGGGRRKLSGVCGMTTHHPLCTASRHLATLSTPPLRSPSLGHLQPQAPPCLPASSLLALADLALPSVDPSVPSLPMQTPGHIPSPPSLAHRLSPFLDECPAPGDSPFHSPGTLVCAGSSTRDTFLLFPTNPFTLIPGSQPGLLL